MKALDLVQKTFPDSSKRTLKIWMKTGRIEIDGKPIRKEHAQVHENQKVTLVKPKKNVEGLNILFEDLDFIVIEKPAGLLSVNSLTTFDSVFTRLKKAYPKRKVYVIHRLDQYTKGPIVFAFNEKTFLDLKEQFKTKKAKRHYLALMHGSFSKDQGVWDHWMKEMKNTKMCITQEEGAKRALSRYAILFQDQEKSLAHIQLQTGRKNQIRVQASFENHPIVGDKKYGLEDEEKFLGLHAFALQLTHPAKNIVMRFYSRPSKMFFHFFKGLNDFLKPFTL